MWRDSSSNLRSFCTCVEEERRGWWQYLLLYASVFSTTEVTVCPRAKTTHPPHPSLSFEQGCDGITRRTLIVTSWWCDAGKSYPFSSSHFLRFGVPHKILLYIDRLCLPISFFYHLYYMYHTLHVFSWLCYRTVTPCVAVIVWVCG